MNSEQLTIDEPRTINNELCSINYDKLCKTNPISEKPKMVVTLVITMTNNNEQRTMNYSKQTQSKPILSRAKSRDLPVKKAPFFNRADGFLIRLFGFSSPQSYGLLTEDALSGTHVGCFRPLLPLCRLVFYRLVFIKRPQSLREVRVMDKQIVTATVRSDKTISFSLTEPFYFTFFQNIFSLDPLVVLQCNLPRIFSQEYTLEG